MKLIGKAVKFRHYQAGGSKQPSGFVVDDAVVIGVVADSGDAPKLHLVYAGGDNAAFLHGPDWQRGFQPAYDVPHQSHDAADNGTFWSAFPGANDILDAQEAAELAKRECQQLKDENDMLKAEIANAVEPGPIEPQSPSQTKKPKK